MKKKLIIIGTILLCLVVIGIFLYSQDNIRFKISYEYVNLSEYSNGKKIKVKIPINNKVKYVGKNEVLELLKSGTGVIYFGYNTCPWCRNAVPILVDSVRENKIDTLYYVDIHSVDISSIKNELYEILDPYLREDDEGNKRLSVPDVYVVKDGEIMGHHIGTVESYKNPYNGMSDEQKEELKEIYNDLIKEIK